MKPYPLILSIAVLCAFPGVHAAGGGGGAGGSESASIDPVLQTANAAIAKKDWSAAQATLKAALDSNPKSADYHNLYAYALRKGSNPDMQAVFQHYEEALRIDPRHRGAHEYIGEAYLMVDQPAKAREHLAALDKLCFFGCEEYTDLKVAITKYERSHAG